MVDLAFYREAGPFTLSQVAEAAGVEGQLSTADGARLVRGVASMASAGPGEITFFARSVHSEHLNTCRALACFITRGAASRLVPTTIALICTDPRLAFVQAAKRLYRLDSPLPHVAPTAFVAPSSKVGENCVIMAGACIREDAVIGDGCQIGPNAVIGPGVVLGAGCSIGANASIAYARLGDHVLIHPGARIGQDGFGYVSDRGKLTKVPQLGRVLIGDNVEIGANSTIDRGMLDDTVIGEGTKIDNLVQIGHNCIVGRHCILVSQVGLSGSVTLGDSVVLGGKVGVADHVTIGAGARVAAKSGVTRSLPAGGVYGGFPARPIREWRRAVVEIGRMGKNSAGFSSEEEA